MGKRKRLQMIMEVSVITTIIYIVKKSIKPVYYIVHKHYAAMKIFEYVKHFLVTFLIEIYRDLYKKFSSIGSY